MKYHHVKCDECESVAFGAYTKIIAKSKCNHPNKRSVSEEYLKDRLPILSLCGLIVYFVATMIVFLAVNANIKLTNKNKII